MILFPNCKINLGLQVLDKRPDGYHNLETVFYPLQFTDALEIIRSANDATLLTVSGLDMDVPAEKNICFKAWSLLKTDFPQLPAVNMHLHKKIPSGAGLGGGSADGAFTLLLLNRKFQLNLSDRQLMDYALKLGSDCPFFILNQPCLASGRGENLEALSLKLDGFRLVIVNPGIHISTAWAFAQLDAGRQRIPLKEVISLPPQHWKDRLVNDFEKPVFEKFPEIAVIREQLYQSGATYAAMTGTGSTVFGLFPGDSDQGSEFPSHYLVKSLQPGF